MGERILEKAKGFPTDLKDYSVAHHSENTGPCAQNLEVDALIIGAGFAGIFMLKTLRDRGYKVTIYEAGSDTGGVWRWNSYPGAAVDSEVPEYEYSWPEVWETWNWKTNYPNYEEIRAYFDHVDKVLHVKKDCSFNTVVVGASFDTETGRWSVKTQDGRVAQAKYLVLGTGFASKRFVPQWPGIENFKGEIHHSSFWPDEEINVETKRCGVIGTGASGVQIIQAWGPKAKQLKVFQRIPNLALPMYRRSLSVEEQEHSKRFYPALFQLREKTYAGFHYDIYDKKTFDHDPEEREAVYERLWREGGFRFYVANYSDTYLNATANVECYKFWAKKARARVRDPSKRDLVAPLDMPHYWGVKRPCLETAYFEQFNRPSVDVVDIKRNPIKEFTETGIMLEDGTHHELDVVALATGFDIVTGAMTQLGLQNIHGTKLEDEWASGISTYLGITVSGYPNMFHMYGPHAPTLLSNGPTTIEVQGRWISDCIDKMERQSIKYINPTTEASAEWKKGIEEATAMGLLPTADSTFMGGNVPNKVKEAMTYYNGIPSYKAEIGKALEDWVGFDIVKAT